MARGCRRGERTRARQLDDSTSGSGLNGIESAAPATVCRSILPLLPRANAVSLLFQLFLWAVVGISQLASAQTGTGLPSLTSAQQIRRLEPEEAQKGLPVRLRGVVTYYDARLHNLFLQDATEGIFALVAPNVRTNIAAGQEIEVEGVSDKGDYAPMVKASAIRILGKGQLPAPRRVTIDQLFTGLEDSQWIEVSGVVRSTTVLDQRRYLNLAMNGERVMAYVENLHETDADQLIDATVRLRGVCYSRYNMKRQLRVPWLAVSSLADIIVEQTSPKQPGEVSLASLGQFNPDAQYGNHVKVSGVVTLQNPDGSLFIQDDGHGLRVQVAQPAKLVPGDRLVVSGYTTLGQYSPVLEDAALQLMGHEVPPLPIPTDLGALLDSPEDLEGMLVRVKASLMNLVDSPGRQTLVLQSSNSIFTASMESSQVDERFKALQIGSQLALTGVFVAQSPERWVPGISRSRAVSVSSVPYSPPESVQILLRSFDDIAVIHQPPWWTLPRLLWTIGIMSFVMLAGLAWVVVLDRRVRRQTQVIQQKVRREGVLEERDRIAREFHDTLEQELAAITIQLDAVSARSDGSSPVARQQLELARNMTRRSLSEARRSVWDLRSHLLENSSLDAALKEVVVPMSVAAGIEITVQSSGTPKKLPALTEHNLLRITQEALTNAFKHSRSKKIVVSLNYEPKQVRLGIRDDGAGFDFQSAGTANGGHFGLLDMRERAEKIGAHFALTTKRGVGTEILVIVNEAVFAGPAAPVKDGSGGKLECKP
jgi:signal transduction histidine kinase